jgi:cytochrome P450 family 9
MFTETLRLYPPAAAVDRVCVQPYTLKSDLPMQINPGEAIFIPIFGLHRDPKYYSDPESFDPERFSEENKHSINPTTYLPFGLGPRSCIGKYKFHNSSLSILHPSHKS